MKKEQPVYIATWEEAGDSDWWFDKKNRLFKRYRSIHHDIEGNQYIFDEVLAHKEATE